MKIIKKILELPVELLHNRQLIWNLSKNDFKTKYAGSYLGIIWAFVQPVVTILVYWFVFQVGFRSQEVVNFPFVLYLTCGMVPWFFFQDALNGGTTALIEYSYLVKKVVFPVDIIPVISLTSSSFIGLFLVLIAIVASSIYGYFPNLLNVIYIVFAALCFIVAVTRFTSALSIRSSFLYLFTNISEDVS